MRPKFLLLICFFYLSMSAQITNLSKLSKGKFYSSDIIKDVNNNIRGYLLLFETDKIAKETYELEYIILDENLAKVTNGFITEMKYEGFMFKADKVRVRASLEKDKLLLKFTDSFNGVEYYERYRMLDISTNDLTEPFIFNKDSIKLNPEFDRKLSNFSDNQSERILLFNKVGMVVNSRAFFKKENVTSRRLVHYDDKFNKVWSYTYNNIKDKLLKDLTYLNSDQDVILLFNHETKNNSMLDWKEGHSVVMLDSKKGILITEFNFPEMDKNTYRVVNCKITDDKVYLMGNYSARSKTGWLDDTNNLGLFKFVLNKQTGKVEESKIIKWETIKRDGFEINKVGKVKKEGYIYIHNMLMLDNGKIVTVAETFESGPIITNNMYLFELSEEFSINQIFTVEKFRNKFPRTAAHSSDIDRYGLFDFIDFQDLGDNEYLFFLNDNEKNSRNRKASTLYGIVSYSEGKFKRQTLNLKTETSSIKAYSAKKGYIMLVENFENNKSSELRLEKINY
ncbi:DUF6770 family protein [Flavobacterium suzhouense]|uniref:DUF6770 family protein n=1 Tax=Flavobacterium suzhouense TaxID=1529638 RepID=A0ABW5NSA2_9FLAO